MLTTREIYNLLFSGGNISRHYLIELSHPSAGNIRLVNNNEEITYLGKTYKVSSFDYTPPDKKGTGASLNITTVDNDLFTFIENADHRYNLKVIGVLNSDGSITPLKVYRHLYGSLSMGDNRELNFTPGTDDRLDMKFNVLIYDTISNKGNA